LNFEHLSTTEQLFLKKIKSKILKKKEKKKFIQNLNFLKNKNFRLFSLYLQNQIEKKKINRIKKEKLKLGTVIFEIKEITFANYVVGDSIEMVYSRLDNTETNALKIENKIAELGWKWNFDNLFSFFLIISFLIFYFYTNFLADAYLNLLESLKNLSYNNDFLIKNVKNLFSFNLISIKNFNRSINFDLLEIFSILYW